MKAAVLFSLTFAAVLLCVATASKHARFEKFYTHIGEVDDDYSVRVHLYLKQKNLDVLEKSFWEVPCR